jgi:membrane protease YdiL (CAAX protease family)
VAGVLVGGSVPIWAYGAAFSAWLLLATWIALALDCERLTSLGLVPTRHRLKEFVVGFALSAALFAALASVRAASVGASWTFGGLSALPEASAGLLITLLLLLPEELLFRGYLFRRATGIAGPWPTLAVSSILFGIYHVAGSGMWGMSAFFTFSMPALGGILFGLAALRTGGLALPIGLHLGGNWVQANVLSFRPEVHGRMPEALWTAPVSRSQFHALTAPDLLVHVPFITVMVLMTITMVLIFRPEGRPAHAAR